MRFHKWDTRYICTRMRARLHTHTHTTKVNAIMKTSVIHKCTQMVGTQFRQKNFFGTFTAHRICPKSSTPLESKSIPDWLCLGSKNTLLGRYSELPSQTLRNRLFDHAPWAGDYLRWKKLEMSTSTYLKKRGVKNKLTTHVDVGDN
jgi:hypothetical protein